jgi:hypothetical protein
VQDPIKRGENTKKYVPLGKYNKKIGKKFTQVSIALYAKNYHN